MLLTRSSKSPYLRRKYVPMFVVSANYRNRKSPYKWLVRKATDPIEKAYACKSVVASGVEFRPSSQSEEGFGCRRVAHAESVEVSGVESVEIKFDGRQTFYNESTGKAVTKLARMELGEDGSILGVLSL